MPDLVLFSNFAAYLRKSRADGENKGGNVLALYLYHIRTHSDYL